MGTIVHYLSSIPSLKYPLETSILHPSLQHTPTYSISDQELRPTRRYCIPKLFYAFVKYKIMRRDEKGGENKTEEYNVHSGSTQWIFTLEASFSCYELRNSKQRLEFSLFDCTTESLKNIQN